MSKVEFGKHPDASEYTPIVEDWWKRGFDHTAQLYLPGDGYTSRRVGKNERSTLLAVVKGRARIALKRHLQSIILEPGDEVTTRGLLQKVSISEGVTVVLAGRPRGDGDDVSWRSNERTKLESELSSPIADADVPDFLSRNAHPSDLQLEQISDAWWARGYECDCFEFPDGIREGPVYTNDFHWDDLHTLHTVVQGRLRCEVHTDKVERFDLTPGDVAKVPRYYFKQPVSVGDEPAIWVIGWPRRWQDLGNWLDEYHRLRQHPVSGELLYPRIAGLSSRYVSTCSDREVLSELRALLSYEYPDAWTDLDGRTIQSPLLRLVEQRLKHL